MKNSYTTIYYKDQKISGIFAATLENDFYNEALLGPIEIHEESIPSRDIPYFYGVSRKPLEFEVTFAFEKPLDIYEIKKYVEMFYNNDYYQPLAFEREDGFMTPIYYVLVTGEPEIEYMRTDVNEYVGYFKFNFRANAPYGFEEGHEKTKFFGENIVLNLYNASLPSTDYLIKYKNTHETSKNITIQNLGTGGFEFYLKPEEEIVIDGRNKTIKSTHPNIYSRWRNYTDGFFKLIPGKNEIYADDEIVEIIYRIPRFI